MAEVVSIAIEVDAKGAVTAFQQVGGEMKKLEQGAVTIGAKSASSFSQMARSQQQARDAAQLLSRALGVEVPRALEKVLAQSRTLGPALAAAFNASVVVGFALAVTKAVYDIVEAWKSYENLVKQIQLEVIREDIKRSVAGIEQSENARRAAALAGRTATLSELDVLEVKHRDRLWEIQLAANEAVRRGDRELLAALTRERAAVEQEYTGLHAMLVQKRLQEDKIAFERYIEEQGQLRGKAGDLEREQEEKRLAALREIAGVEEEYSRKWFRDLEERERQLDAIAEETRQIEEAAALAVLPYWEQSYAGIIVRARQRVREVEELLFYGLIPTEEEAARRVNAIWAETAAHMRNQLASEFERLFEDIAGGNLGQRIRAQFRRLVSQIVADFVLQSGLMRTALWNVFATVLGLPGRGFAVPAAAVGAGFGITGAGGTATTFAFLGGTTGLIATTTGLAELPITAQLRANAAQIGLAAMPLSAGQGAANVGAVLPAGAAALGVGRAGEIGGLLRGLGSTAFGALMGLTLVGSKNAVLRGIGGALLGGIGGVALLGALTGNLGTALAGGFGGLAGLGIGALAFPIVGALLGGLLAIFGFGGPHKGEVARIQVIEPALRQIQLVKDAYNVHQLDYSSAITQLEQLRAEAIRKLNEIGGEQRHRNTLHINQRVDAAEREINTIEAERARRAQLVFGAPMFEQGGFVTPALAPVATAGT